MTTGTITDEMYRRFRESEVAQALSKMCCEEDPNHWIAGMQMAMRHPEWARALVLSAEQSEFFSSDENRDFVIDLMVETVPAHS